MVFATTFISFVAIVSAAPSGTNFSESTPLQNNIKQEMANGGFSANDIEGSPEYSIQVLEKNESHIKLKSTTKIIFKNPRGAGYGNNRWPKFGDNGIVGDNKVKNAILSDIQNIPNKTEKSAILAEWDKYNFEYGKRLYVVSETYEVTYTGNSSSYATISSDPTFTNDILMGFTVTTPQINHTWQADLYIPITFCVPWSWFGCQTLNEHVASIKAGVDIGGAFGLRLPTVVNLNMPDTMLSGNSYSLSTSINGADWDSSNYSLANVPAENGNEFVARYSVFLGVHMWLIGYGDFGPYVDSHLDYGESFKTPIGPDETFPLPAKEYPPDSTGLKVGRYGAFVGVGLKISPYLGTQGIIASWTAKGDAIGTGSIDYRLPNINYSFGPVKAGDYDTTTNRANIRLSDYKYYLSICKLTLSGRMQTGGWLPFYASGYDDLYSVGCNGLTGGLYLGIHPDITANHVDGSALVK